MKELQESRARKNGLNAVECALGKELAAEFIAMDDDPFRQRGGGMLRLSEGRQAQMLILYSFFKRTFRSLKLFSVLYVCYFKSILQCFAH